MIVCKYTPRIVVALENEIQVIKNQSNYQVDAKYNIIYNSNIQQVKMCNNEKFIAVAIAP